MRGGDEANAPAGTAGPAAFDHLQPRTRIVAGAGGIDRIGELADALGAGRALLVCSRRQGASPLGAQVQAALGPRLAAVFDQVVPHPTTDLVRTGARLARAEGADLLVSLGGGSASDTAKGISLVLAEGEAIEERAAYLDPQQRLVVHPLPTAKLPLLAIPLTAAGAEVTPGLGLTNAGGIKQIWWDEKLAARIVVLDPQAAAAAVPFSLVAATSMNATAHCLEGLYSRGRTPISDALALGALGHLVAGLEGLLADPGDVAARGRLQVGAVLSGMVVTNAKPALHHAICHVLGARCHVPHGVANAIMLPHVVGYNQAAAADALGAVAAILGATRPGEPAAGAAALPAVLHRWQERLGLPRSLADFHIMAADAPRIAAETMQDWCVAWNPRPVREADVADLVRAAI